MPTGITAFQARHYYDYLDTALIISQSDQGVRLIRSDPKISMQNAAGQLDGKHQPMAMDLDFNNNFALIN